MDRAVVEHYLAQITAAASVRELHALVRAVSLAHEGDPDAERVEQACWAAALRLVAESPSGRHPPPPPRVPGLHMLVTPVPRRAERRDWKERAAPA